MKMLITSLDREKILARIQVAEARLREVQASTTQATDVGNVWHDNPAYDEVVMRTRALDAQLAKLHELLNGCTVVPLPISNEKVALGTTVVMNNDGEEQTWQIVGFESGDPDNGLIAYNTPLARQLLGARVGDIKKVNIGGGSHNVKILSIAVSREGT